MARRAQSAATASPRSFLRSTRQRAAISDVLGGASGFMTAQEIHDALKSRGAKAGLTTVYRTLQGLADAGQVDVLRRDSGETLYRRCFRPDHHHHLVCKGCGASVEIESPELEIWTEEVAEKHGFVDVSHTLEVYGFCRSCPARAARRI